ncbi:hypothetical protein E3C22_19510 [Jiella endophytica]|uniref:Uncharacterized protein n=1 Tax=Jiella endophytica TaxID=2558362 RepID=A0A4Y8RD18_9HYPH|nr:hypothetical protein [Jiella endophytica]TFF19854.1 hypothetical protein E3C22_19510 [Jiella endophytica]
MSLRLDHSLLDNSAADASRALTETRRRASGRRFGPTGTVRCTGRSAFRSALARDLGLLLDLDPEVAAWACLPAVLEFANRDGEVVERVPDFLVREEDGRERFLDAGETGLTPADPSVAYRAVPEDEIRQEPLISNARDAMRYAKRVVPLGDRVRLLAYLAEMSPITLVEAASAMRESSEPVGAVIALALRRIVRIDWEDAQIGPETPVRAR